MTRIVLAKPVLLFGAALIAGVAWLISLGGTWGYLVLGLLLVVSALLLFARREGGLAVYGVAILFALGWGLWVVRGLHRGSAGFRGYGAEGMVLVGSVAVAAVIAGRSATDRMAQEPRTSADVPDGE